MRGSKEVVEVRGREIVEEQETRETRYESGTNSSLLRERKSETSS